MHELLKAYQKRLPNLSEKNRSLFLPKVTERQFIDVHNFDFLDDKPSFSIIERLISQRKKIVLSQDLDPRDKDANRVGRILKNILRTDKMIREERGAKDLLLGYPFVEGKTQDDKCVRCPLIFFPVTLWQEDGKWLLGFRDTEEIKFNQTFILAYSQFNNTKLDKNLLENSLDNLSKNTQSFRNELYEILEKNNLSINFNQANFEDRLVPFSPYTKADFSLLNQTGKLKLMPQAVLGVFARSDSFLAPDYDFLVNNSEIEDLEYFFQESDNQENNLNKKTHISEKEIIAPYPVDASQETVLKQIKLGKSLTIQGPPGTGKSQLISNLIADCIANQKRVLLVCQKRVALDIVHQRLDDKNISKYTALVHDFRNDRKQIYQQIAEQIDRVNEKMSEKFDFETYQLEERFLLLSREIDHHLYELESFRNALFDRAECGLSVKELYLTSDLNAPYLDFSEVYNYLDFSKIHDFRKRLKNYFYYQEQIGSENYVWKSRKSFATRDFKDLETIKNLLLNFSAFKDNFENLSEKLIAKKLDFSQAETILNQKNRFALWLGFIESESALQYFRKVLNYENTDYNLLLNLENQILQCFDNEGVEISLSSEKLDEYVEYLATFRDAQNGFISRKRWDLFSKEKRQLKKLFLDNKLEISILNIDKLQQKLDNRIQLEALRKVITQTNWLAPNTSNDDNIQATDNLYQIEKTLQKRHFETWFRHHRSALKAQRLWNDGIKDILDKVVYKNFTYRRLSKLLFEAVYILKQFLEDKTQYLYYLRESQFSELWEAPEKAQNWATILEQDFELLCESDKLRDSFSEIELKTVEILKKYNFEINTENLLNVFENSLRIEWITHIERKYPILRSASSLKISQLEKDIKIATKEKTKISDAILQLRAEENTCKNLNYNRLGNITTYRDLYHQVNKKRNVWVLRKLIREFSDEIFRLIPCWMASPESVSAIFEPQEIFDLVIFDEASQCYAEKGIPAMYRGKQVVIAGDSQQLQPSNLYTPKWEEDLDENSPETEIDSLLDLGNRYLNSIQLKGHYRSQSLDLIDFSNKHFYKNKLSLIPDYQYYIQKNQGIEFLKVDGFWKENTNLLEAHTVVNLVEKLLREGKTDIGIITFNSPQQMLILDLFESKKVALPANLFVKNIENVQGDEREIIIFSVGYAPSESGKFRMNFGLLSQAKGENRLNVAVTRAKQKIYVVSSIFPHQIKAEELKHEGAKLLQKYLQYALDVSEKRYVPALPILEKYHFLNFLKDKIESHFQGDFQGFEVQNSVPFADLIITSKKENKDQEYKLILTDDNLFFEAISAKESHVYQPQLLQDKNWTFLRIYSREFWKNRAEIIEKIKQFAQF